MKNEATFGQLIAACEKIGWDKGIKYFEKQTYNLENFQADLFAGNLDNQKQAQKLSITISKQLIAISSLKKYRAKLIKANT